MLDDTERGSPVDRAARRLGRHPAAGLAIFFITGIWLGLSLAIDPFYVLCAGGAALLTALLPGSRLDDTTPPAPVAMIGRRTVGLLLAILCVGWCIARIKAENDGAAVLKALAAETDADVEIVGVISGQPALDPVTARGTARSRFSLSCTAIRAAGSDRWHSVRANLLVRWFEFPGRRSSAHYGDEWVMRGRLRRWALADDESGDSVFAYYSLDAQRGGAKRLSSGHGNSFAAWCFAQGEAAKHYLSIGISDLRVTESVYHALVLGYRRSLPRDLRDAFAATGTAHVFAVSGMHVAIIALLIVFVLAQARIPRVYWVLFMAPLLTIYTLMVGAPASAVRSAVMAVLFFAAPLLERRADTYSSLAAAAVAILAVDPTQLFDVGFILSFVAVIGLVALYPVFNAPFARLCEPDPLAPPETGGRILAARACGRYLASLVAVSLAAWLVSTPLMAFFFGRFSLIAIVGNLVVVPLSFFVVVCGSLSIVLGSCLEVLADLFNHSALVFTVLMTDFMRLMAAIPVLNCEVPRPPVWLMGAWYLALAWLALRAKAAPPPRPDRPQGTPAAPAPRPTSTNA